MRPARFAIVDPGAGIAGDMLLGALLDAGVPEDWLKGLPDRLGLTGVTVEIGHALRCGVRCARVHVRLPRGEVEHPNPEFEHAHVHPAATHERGAGHLHQHAGQPHAHEGDGAPHRHLGDLLAIVERAPLSPWVREKAIAAFRLLCAEEGRVHGVPMDEVALHEVGALDALVDIVGGIEGFERLGITDIAALPLALGSGWVRTAHGVMAVPTPVTARLVEGLGIGPNGPVTGEATTPTGAVLLRVLVNRALPARWRAGGVGWGAGSRDTTTHPNALRLILAESSDEGSQVVTLSTDVDDMSPEYVDPLRDAVVAAGALDVQVWMTAMKKGRPGIRIEVICDTSRAEGVTEALFLHSTTTGVRRHLVERITLARRVLQVPRGDGPAIRVKVVEAPAGPRVKAEFEDVRRVAIAEGRPAIDVAREAEEVARSLLDTLPDRVDSEHAKETA